MAEYAAMSGAFMSTRPEDEFESPFWCLDQIVGWAETRQADAVRFAANGKENTAGCLTHFAGLPSACGALWRESGWTKDDAGEWMERIHWFAKWLVALGGANRDTVFPTIEYLQLLFRTGELNAVANSPGESKSYRISREDWGGLYITDGGKCERLDVWRMGRDSSDSEPDFKHTRVTREEVLRVFPREAVIPTGMARGTGSAQGVSAVVVQDTPKKLNKAQLLARALLKCFDGKRPEMTRPEALTEVENAGLVRKGTTSERTLTRAYKLAWPTRR